MGCKLAELPGSEKEADVPPAACSMLQHWLGKKYRPGVRDGSDAMTRHIVLF
jgi:hypothetical protein